MAIVLDRIRRTLEGSRAAALGRWKELVREATHSGKDTSPDPHEIIGLADAAGISSDAEVALSEFAADCDSVERHARAMAGIEAINATIANELTASKAKSVAGLEAAVKVATESLRTLEGRLATVTGAQTALGHEQADARRARCSSPRMFPDES
jgi:hypothetical protein